MGYGELYIRPLPFIGTTLIRIHFMSQHNSLKSSGGLVVKRNVLKRFERVATLTDALGGATGVYVQPRFGAEESRVSIRGSGLQRTFHGRGLKLMQDGVPLNLADGSFDFQAVEPLSARYVEVWRGANALQYGAANLGGAVNFVSPNGYNADDLRLRVEGGSFGYGRAQLSTGGVTDRLDHYVALTGFRQDGFRDHARQETGRLSANLGFTFTPQAETRFYFGHVDSRSDLPGSITRGQLEEDPRQAQAGNVTLDQERNIRWTRLSNKTVLQDGPHRFEGFAFVSDKRLNHPIFQVIDQESRNRKALERIESIHFRREEWKKLLETYEKLIDTADTDQEMADIYARMARICSDALGEEDRESVALYAEALDTTAASVSVRGRVVTAGGKEERSHE